MKNIQEFFSEITPFDYMHALLCLFTILIIFAYMAYDGNCKTDMYIFGILSILCILLYTIIMVKNHITIKQLIKYEKRRNGSN